jgi:hypothetical protein
MDNIKQDNTLHIPMQQYQLNYYKHQKIKECQNSSCVYSMIIQSQLTLIEHSVISMCNNAIYCPNNTDYNVTLFHGDVCLEN